jgi:hypothetical protein
MELKTVTYTSLARLDLTGADLADIHATGRRLNALDGVTGLLIFNGTRFVQVIEGGESAIDDLVERLRADDRHSAFEIRDERIVAERAFPDWSMELVTVSARYFEAKEEIAKALPTGLSPAVRELILNMARRIAAPVEIPD